MDTPGSKLHHLGSSGFWSVPVNLVAKSLGAQTFIQIPILRDQLKKHPHANPRTFAEELSRRMVPGQNVLIVPNADVAWAAFGATEISQDPLVQNLAINTIVTDHFTNRMHVIWPTAHGNKEKRVTMCVLDERSKEVAQNLLDSQWKRVWGKRDRPEIIVNPFPIDPAQEKIMPQVLRENRGQALDPTDPFVRPGIALLLGGASVQADYMATIAQGVGYWTQIYSTFKDKPETQGLQQAILKQHGAVDLAKDNLSMILFLNAKMTTTPPDIIVVKPGEMSNHALLPTSAFGGGIILFSPPVGDQEEQNLNFLRLEKLLPSKKDNEQLIHDLLNSPSKQTINHWLRRARELRTICLPKNPYEARTFIYRLYNHGILLASYLQNQHLVPPNGALKYYQQLEARN